MPVNSLPEDKPKIAFHSAMMAIQNFGFFMVSKFYSPKLKKDIPSLTYITHSYTGMINLNVFFMHLLDDQNIHE